MFLALEYVYRVFFSHLLSVLLASTLRNIDSPFCQIADFIQAEIH